MSSIYQVFTQVNATLKIHSESTVCMLPMQPAYLNYNLYVCKQPKTGGEGLGTRLVTYLRLVPSQTLFEYGA